MTATQGAVAARAASASDVLRPAAHRQFKLLPVVLPQQPGWNARVAGWAGARG